MADSTNAANLAAPRTHRRQISRTQPILTRTSTNDPLAAANPEPRRSSTTPAPPPKDPSAPSQSSTPAKTSQTPVLRDFSFLMRSEIYHPLTNIDSVAPFRAKVIGNELTPSTSIPELLKNGQFRQAAQAATNRITSPPPPPPAELFDLVYIRLAALTLLDATDIAAAESVALGDLTSAAYISQETGTNFLPWSLRLIATRLQSLSYSDPRRALTGYYDLTTEARSIYSKTPVDDADSRLLWKARLRDLGIRVANCLIEMSDWDGAKRHLESLRTGLGEGLDGREEDDMLRGRIALVLLRIGDLKEARKYLEASDDTEDWKNSSYAEALRPLLSLAQGQYRAASTEFRGGLVSDALTRQNRAVCAIYAGRLNEAKDLLLSLVDDKIAPRTVVFNLSTTFELLSDKARSMKLGLAETLAERDGTSIGWETVPARFKLAN